MTPVGLELLSKLTWELRFLSMSAQAAHWRAFGPSAWGDHALYKLIYEKTGELLDPLAEILTSYARMEDRKYVCPLEQARYVHLRTQDVWPAFERALEDPDQTSAFFYEQLLSLTRDFRSFVADMAHGTELTYGLEDILGSTAGELEHLAFFLERRAQVLLHPAV